jgi:hypothetical protein
MRNLSKVDMVFEGALQLYFSYKILLSLEYHVFQKKQAKKA